MTLLGKAINDRLKEKRMGDLDKKLEEIVIEASKESYGPNKDTERRIAKIKQAFVDGGWREIKYASYIHMANDARFEASLMTGQEWYERFKKESPTWSKSDITAMSFERAYLKAAKKAGGIK